MRKKRKLTKEHKEKIGKANKGKILSEETRKKISEKLKGIIFSKEHREKLRKASTGNHRGLGYRHTKEEKIKISKANIGRKQSQETIDKRIKKGKEHYNWQGGKSFEPYGLEFNKDLKEVIRNRDRRKCQICGKTELENKVKLSVHHIDYNKQNNNPNNLISLCNHCHIKTNFRRNYWINYFKKRI